MQSDAEIFRLQKVQSLGESVARLPESCVANLTECQMSEVRGSALHDALMDLKNVDKGRSDLVNQIHDLEEKQKRSYISLYKKVSAEIGSKLVKSIS